MNWEKVIRIGEFEYDISNFYKKHPGGNVILYTLANTGADATHIFEAFHRRTDRKARLILASLPKRIPELAAIQQPDQLNKDFEILTKELEEDGYFRVSGVHTFYRFVELVLLFAFGMYLFSIHQTVAGIFIHGIFGGRCGWLGHELGHNSMMISIPYARRTFHSLLYGFGLGISADKWNQMHNKHHAATQKIKHDLDLDTTPLVAFFDRAFSSSRNKTTMIPFLTKYQAYLFLPIISGLFILNFWIYFLHPRHVLSNLKKQTWIDGISMISGHCIRTAMYMFATGSNEILKSYLIAYCACMYVSAIYNFGHFSLSHTHLDVVEDNKHKSWLAYALEHTVNISPQNPLVSWTMGYLNCQIEHHLWPSMPQYHQPNVSQKVREFCHKHGYEYKVMTYWQAWKAMILNLQQVSDRILLKNKSQ